MIFRFAQPLHLTQQDQLELKIRNERYLRYEPCIEDRRFSMKNLTVRALSRKEAAPRFAHRLGLENSCVIALE